MRVLALVLVAAAVAATPVLGGQGDYSSPTATFKTLQAAVKAGDRRSADACFTARLARDPDGHEDICGELQATLRRATIVELGKEQITGNAATVPVFVDGRCLGGQEAVLFTREGDVWKINRYLRLDGGGKERKPGPEKAGKAAEKTETEIPVEDLPATVAASLVIETAGLKVKRVVRATRGERTVYEIGVRLANGDGRLLIDPNGKVVGRKLEESMAPADAPAPVREAFLKYSRGAPIGRLFRRVLNDITYFVVEAEKASLTLYLGPDGTPVARQRIMRTDDEFRRTSRMDDRD
ncbi:MAG: hypothetical protein FJ290_08665 [Planctomycetes bacterium]|nr:hypothetical protein [Planctomycetota bacterium]